jgi:2-polyprenyl-6-hydroxyphenyl methylase/3-demethylubiquinone-9 3-methyltransferase
LNANETRFEFGKNWQSFLLTINGERIDQATVSLEKMLGEGELPGKRFLDIGCGSGLFSLAAHRLGASVISLDYDEQSVACTKELRHRFTASDDSWDVMRASVLDDEAMQSLGHFDVVYSWGVLHHTGQMNRAIDVASDRVAAGGLFFIAIYNDQGGGSRRWLAIKKTYHRVPRWLRPAWVTLVAGVYECKFALARAVRLQNPLPLADWSAKKADRGMSAWHDWVDWIGGLPFEVATPEQIIVPLRSKAFVLENLKTVGNGWGCNEYVFRRTSASPDG